MPKRRDFGAGSYVHCFSRGSRRDVLFIDDHDAIYFLKKLQRTCEITGDSVVGYCLIPNHYHLIMRVRCRSSLPHTMQMLNTGYAKRFCARYDEYGSVFQGRYGSVTIDSFALRVFISRYIHRNPHKHKVWDGKLQEFPNSSLKFYLTDQKHPIVDLKKNSILQFFDSQESYLKYVLGSDKQAYDWGLRLGARLKLYPVL